MTALKTWIARILMVLVKGMIIFLVAIVDIISFPVHLLIQKPCKKLSENQANKATEIKVGSPYCTTYRSVETHKAISKMIIERNLVTVNDIFKTSSTVFRFKRCLGTRKIYSESYSTLEDGKQVVKYEFGPYNWKSFNAVTNEMKALSKGLFAIGLEEKQPIVIFSETRPEWLIVALACFDRNIPIASVNTAMHEDEVIHSINTTEPTVLITSFAQVAKLSPIIDKFPSLRAIIYFEHKDAYPDLKCFPDYLSVLTYSSVCEMGEEIEIVSAAPKPDDAAVIMFTSGTTNIPKGVVITHRNLVSAIRTLTDLVEPTTEDVMIGYLPLANIFEFISDVPHRKTAFIQYSFPELVALTAGAGIGYSSSLTLTNDSPQIKEGTEGDASMLKPSIFLATPLILNRISRNIKKKEMSSIVGGQVRLIICGGAPLCPITQLHVSLCLCTCVIQGYGMTETTGCGFSQKVADLGMGQVGGPVMEAYIRLCEIEEDYEETKYPTGELLIGGAFVSPGYYDILGNEGDCFLKDNYIWWFRTGDIAQVNPDGSFQIIDRRKNRIKLQHGDYVCLGKVEAEFETNKYIENICLHVDPIKSSSVAIASILKESFEELSASLGLTETPFAELFNEQELTDAVIDDLNTHIKLYQMKRNGIPIIVTFVSDDWTTDMDLITAQCKLARTEIYKKYNSEIRAMYEEIVSEDLPNVGEILKIIYSVSN